MPMFDEVTAVRAMKNFQARYNTRICDDCGASFGLTSYDSVAELRAHHEIIIDALEQVAKIKANPEPTQPNIKSV